MTFNVTMYIFVLSGWAVYIAAIEQDASIGSLDHDSGDAVAPTLKRYRYGADGQDDEHGDHDTNYTGSNSSNHSNSTADHGYEHEEKEPPTTIFFLFMSFAIGALMRQFFHDSRIPCVTSAFPLFIVFAVDVQVRRV